MNEKMLINEWQAVRRRSLQMLPVALGFLAILCGVVYLEDLHHSDEAFLPGLLVGVFGYWVVLEWMTVVRVGRLLRSANQP